jgi:hypothetical protein
VPDDLPGGVQSTSSVCRHPEIYGSNERSNVHIIGVNWPHHVFVNQEFQVVGAE